MYARVGLYTQLSSTDSSKHAGVSVLGLVASCMTEPSSVCVRVCVCACVWTGRGLGVEEWDADRDVSSALCLDVDA